MQKTKIIFLLLLILCLSVSVIEAKYPKQMYLQHSATLLAFVFLWMDIKKNYLSVFANLFFCCFILLHIIGARWIYSFVPYEVWINDLAGTDFNSGRNHYDRFVHFSFGILFFPAIYELVQRRINRWKLSILFTWLFLQTFSMFYEIFEWSLTLMVSEKEADNYNGQQGDPWDAQKDMTLAMLGSCLMVVFYSLKKRKSN